MLGLCAALVAAVAPRKVLLTLQPGETGGWSDALSDADDGTQGILPTHAFEPPRLSPRRATREEARPVAARPLARHSSARSPPASA